MRIAFITAALGEMRLPLHADQNVPVEHYSFTYDNFPARTQNMGARLQARIPKMFGWQIVPGADLYIWLDASFSLSQPISVEWLVASLGSGDLAIFAHPDRVTVRQEAEFIRKQIAQGNRYLVRRYLHEDIDGHLALLDHLAYPDDCLYATGALVYRPTATVQAAIWRWWAYTSRYHSVDQLSAPVAFWQEGLQPVILPGNIFTCPMFRYENHR